MTSSFVLATTYGNLRRASDAAGGLPAWAAWTIAVAAIILCLAVIVTLYLIVRMRCELWRNQNTVVVQCAGCGRAIRIYRETSFGAAMCRDCLRAGMRRMSAARREKEAAAVVALEQNATERCDEVRSLQRLSSTYFRIGSLREPAKKSDKDEDGGSVPDDDASTSRETSPDEKVAHPCKICMDDLATVVLLPCGHGGLCEGCAKDLVLRTTKCYMCRKRIEMLGLVREAGSDELLHPIAPSHLHHSQSRARDADAAPDDAVDSRTGTEESGDIEEGLRQLETSGVDSPPPPPASMAALSTQAVSEPVAA
ncbi:hypothetical protein FOZ61_008604 [Perkinsus olseni]|uniref:RING-type domain-containing protein n=1 Tax=Perkinsus olseni TaxID=32597 RepID=A0A7J6M6D9_PEROL|nr:hypothetical protein FOZ61_008604 [Perkinsus olseni]